ncbi:MAG: type II toxin-antitoxin system VapC family toxin [Thermoleophilaceae bacterium]|jgi:predicted nucleic acid-binding protein
MAHDVGRTTDDRRRQVRPPVPRGALTLVVDASVAFSACLAENGFVSLAPERPAAPPLMWPEVRSALRQAAWRGALTREHALESLERLESAPIEANAYSALGRDAWLLAEQLGWAKTYDAEYVALARHLRCRLLTADERLRRGAAHLAEVIGPTER